MLTAGEQERIHRAFYLEHKSMRAIARETGPRYKTVLLTVSDDLQKPYQLTSPHSTPIFGPYQPRVQETRISQEILLGMGGVHTLRALGITPAAWHLNEGLAAFLNLERCRALVDANLSFYKAHEVVAAKSLFTPLPHHGYRLGVPSAGEYSEVINSDATRYGGSGAENTQPMSSGPIPWQSCSHSLLLTLPAQTVILKQRPTRRT